MRIHAPDLIVMHYVFSPSSKATSSRAEIVVQHNMVQNDKGHVTSYVQSLLLFNFIVRVSFHITFSFTPPQIY